MWRNLSINEIVTGDKIGTCNDRLKARNPMGEDARKKIQNKEGRNGVYRERDGTIGGLEVFTQVVS